MRFLLDTHLAFWIPVNDKRVSSVVRELLAEPKNEFFFSVVNLWEISIKRGQGKGGFTVNPRDLQRHMLANGYEELPVTGAHVIELERLPLIHKDPFDRILIAQAIVERITLLTVDSVIAQYPGPIQSV